ncbi:MAG: hypothetical protein U0414_13145 [Polyangiaceae bacterium]
MGLWPFGKGKENKPSPPDEDEVEFSSRVVTVALSSGALVRGKLTVHFHEPLGAARAERTMELLRRTAEEDIAKLASLDELLAKQNDILTDAIQKLPEAAPRPRTIEIVALHAVEDAGGRNSPSSIPPAALPASLRPDVPKVEAAEKRAPASRVMTPRPAPVVAGRGPMDSSPASIAAPTTRRPSGQMLSVRGAPLVPTGTTAENAGKALAPLLRDAATKLMLGLLRAYDLFAIRKMSLNESDTEIIEAMVPVSSAPLGFFWESRSEEFHRWTETLGEEAFGALRAEAEAAASYLFYQSLDHARVEQTALNVVLERSAEGAFVDGKVALAKLGRYLHPAEGSTVAELAASVRRSLGRPSGEARAELGRIDLVLTPLLAALQDDLSIAAAQVRYAVAK